MHGKELMIHSPAITEYVQSSRAFSLYVIVRLTELRSLQFYRNSTASSYKQPTSLIYVLTLCNLSVTA